MRSTPRGFWDFELPAFGVDFIFFRYRDDFERDLIEIGPGLNVFVIADHDGNFAGEFPTVLAVEQIDEAMIVARDEEGDFRAIRRNRHAPLHFKAVSDGLEV